jgi:hypothetical protein
MTGDANLIAKLDPDTVKTDGHTNIIIHSIKPSDSGLT